MTAIDFTAFVDELATISGETIRPFFRSAIGVEGLGVENKSRSGGFDPVTAADRAAEVAMRTLIKRTFPEHGVIGEEFEADRPDAEYVWVLDPIDGTKSFISGMPVWGTLIALTRRGEPIYGMMHQPFTREHFSGDGRGARYRGPAGDRDLRVRPCASLRRCRAVHDLAALDERGRPRPASPASKRTCGCRAMAATVTPIACSPPAMSISSSRPN